MGGSIHGEQGFRRIAQKIWRGIVVGSISLAMPSLTFAGKIHSHHHSSTTVSIEAHEKAMVSAEAVMDRWSDYFLKALQEHNLRVEGPNMLNILSTVVSSDGTLPQTPMVEYLDWRRGLKPERFDSYHPQLGALLNQDQLIRSTADPAPTVPSSVSSETLTPPVSPPVSPPPILPPPVPEPSSGLIALLLFGSAAAIQWKRTLRARSERPSC